MRHDHHSPGVNRTCSSPKWPDTEFGALRSKAKFWVSNPAAMDEARERLTEIGVAFLSAHPLYGDADAIIATPGHDRQALSCGEDLARRLARAARMPLIRTETPYIVREQAKGDAPVDLSGQFSIDADLSDATVIVIDDCIKSGRTLRHMGEAAREAGAARVLALAPVRTMRGS